jgi:hypothetical protein
MTVKQDLLSFPLEILYLALILSVVFVLVSCVSYLKVGHTWCVSINGIRSEKDNWNINSTLEYIKAVFSIENACNGRLVNIYFKFGGIHLQALHEFVNCHHFQQKNTLVCELCMSKSGCYKWGLYLDLCVILNCNLWILGISCCKEYLF